MEQINASKFKEQCLALLDNLDPEGIVRWHREKAGTIEHVHRTLKDELGAGVMPSTRFGVNAAWFPWKR